MPFFLITGAVARRPAAFAWNHADLTGATGARAAAGDPAGYTWDVDRTEYVLWIALKSGPLYRRLCRKSRLQWESQLSNGR